MHVTKAFSTLLPNKKNGFGILIDDDMNVFCSEWKDNKMDGITFIYLNCGIYTYGNWKNNHPNGINVLKNDKFIAMGMIEEDIYAQNTLAVDDAINHLLIFNGE